jgi:hypothetical protein
MLNITLGVGAVGAGAGASLRYGSSFALYVYPVPSNNIFLFINVSNYIIFICSTLSGIKNNYSFFLYRKKFIPVYNGKITKSIFHAVLMHDALKVIVY